MTSFEDRARAEAEKMWPSYPIVGFSGAEDRQHAFVLGARWAREKNADIWNAAAQLLCDDGLADGGISDHLRENNPYRSSDD